MLLLALGSYYLLAPEKFKEEFDFRKKEQAAAGLHEQEGALNDILTGIADAFWENDTDDVKADAADTEPENTLGGELKEDKKVPERNADGTEAPDRRILKKLRYNAKIKGVCLRRLPAFSAASKSPKTAEPLPDIEA